MSSASRRARSARMPGPIVVLVSAVVVAAAVAGAWHALGRRPSPTGVVDLLAVDGEYAVMIRDVARDPGRSFLSLMSTERGEVWGAMIPGYEPRSEPRTHLTATAGVITLRAITGGVPYVHVFAAARGAKLGRYPLGPERPVPAVMPAPGAAASDATALGVAASGAAAPSVAAVGAATPDAGSLAGDGQSFELVADAQGAIDVIAIDLEQGAPLWRRALGPGPAGPLWLRERHLLVHAAGRLHVLDRRIGEPVHGRADGVPLAGPCAVSDRVYGVDAGQVHVLSLTSGELRPTGIAAARLAGLCGTHGDLDGVDVLAVTENDTAALVAVDARTLAVSWRLALQQPLHVSEALYRTAPDALAGSWPRFAPVLDGQAEPRLVIIDVETGRIAHAGTPTPLLRDAHLLRAGERFYLWTPAGPTLAVLDGATGALAAAIELPGMAPIWPRHLAGGRIWVARQPGGDDPGQAWLVLDDQRLQVTAAGRGNDVTPEPAPVTPVTDVRARFAAALGLP